MTVPRKFPLDVVLRVREVRERLARGGVARAKVEEVTVQARRDAAAELLHGRTIPATIDPQAFIAAFTARRSMAAQLHALEELREIRRHETAQATDVWRAAEQDRSGVDTLADRHRADLVTQDLAADQRELDDIASRRRSTPDRCDGGDR